MLTCLSVPPTPGRCWYGRSHYHTVHGWSLYIYGIRQQWLPHPQGFVIDRIWTLDDAAAPVGILYRAPLQNINIKKNHEKCIFKEAVCIQRMFPIHMSYVAFSPLAVILNFYRQTQRANVTFLWNLKAFRVVLSCIFQGNKTYACKVGRQQMSFTLRLSTIHFS